jgi:hypothetical protein
MNYLREFDCGRTHILSSDIDPDEEAKGMLDTCNYGRDKTSDGRRPVRGSRDVACVRITFSAVHAELKAVDSMSGGALHVAIQKSVEQRCTGVYQDMHLEGDARVRKLGVSKQLHTSLLYHTRSLCCLRDQHRLLVNCVVSPTENVLTSKCTTQNKNVQMPQPTA